MATSRCVCGAQVLWNADESESDELLIERSRNLDRYPSVESLMLGPTEAAACPSCGRLWIDWTGAGSLVQYAPVRPATSQAAPVTVSTSECDEEDAEYHRGDGGARRSSLLSLLIDCLDDLYDQAYGWPAHTPHGPSVWLARTLDLASEAFRGTGWQQEFAAVAARIRQLIASGTTGHELGEQVLGATDRLRSLLVAES